MIETKLWRCFLLLTILVQFTWARPAPENEFNNLSFGNSKDVCLKKIQYDQKEESAEKDTTAMSASQQLLLYTLKGFQNMALDSAKKAKVISENILKHPDILNSQAPKILELKKNLTQFEAKYSACDGLENLFELVEIFTKTTENYVDSQRKDILDDNEKLIAELLSKYGNDDIENKAWSDLKEFAPKFKAKFESLKQDLNRQEGEVGQKLLKWFKRFENLSNSEETSEAFVEFLLLFDDDNFETS